MDKSVAAWHCQAVKLNKQTTKFLSDIGRKGGQKTSPKKAEAARQNGRKHISKKVVDTQAASV